MLVACYHLSAAESNRESSMKINFPLPKDRKLHHYCPNCHSEEVIRTFRDDKTFYVCESCQMRLPRLIVIDPKVAWWIDNMTQEYWHESVGAFIFNNRNEALFFERTIFPFAMTIPAGHLEAGVSPGDAVVNEVLEEVGIRMPVRAFSLFSEEDVLGDKCRRGADNHRWHLYTARLEDGRQFVTNDEGKNPQWLSLSEAKEKELTYPTRYFIEKYGDKLFER
jgi:8-oxo-dGTP pyrophosphatase MutT (NUDIX family)/predicted RNA-binding Zn-ribbon protein involved in translation (DUF1610 family)